MLGFARVKGAPDWPSKVVSEAGASRLKLAFLGTTRVGVVSRSNFFPYTATHLAKVATKENLSRGPFKTGIAELRKAVEEQNEEKRSDEEVSEKEQAKKKQDTKKGLRRQKAENDRLFRLTMAQSATMTSWRCRRCSFKTGYRYKARIHAVTCNSLQRRRAKRTKNLPCWLCPHLPGFGSVRLLRAHSRKKHGQCSDYICTKHKKPVSCSSRKIYFRHMRENHRAGTQLVCSYCQATVKSRRVYNRQTVIIRPFRAFFFRYGTERGSTGGRRPPALRRS
jgi:hypothetical protein